jgi:hypothetical protein
MSLRTYAIPTTGLLLAVGCSPATAKIDILDVDGDGIDDAIDDDITDGGGEDGGEDGGGDGSDGGGDGGDGGGDGDGGDGGGGDGGGGDGGGSAITLTGAWSLTGLGDYPLEQVYEARGCTYTFSFGLEMTFGAEEDGSFRGDALLLQEVRTEGRRCENEGYSEAYESRASAERTGDRDFDILIRDLGLAMDCRATATDLDCAFEADQQGPSEATFTRID